MEVRMNGMTEKPSHLFTNEEVVVTPMREKWSEDARQLDDLVTATKSDVFYLGWGGASNGCGGGWDEGTLDCAPELSLHLVSGFGEEAISSVVMSLSRFRTMEEAIQHLISRGVRKYTPMVIAMLGDRLAEEIISAYKGEGTSIKKRDDMHKMAEANKAFAHFRW